MKDQFIAVVGAGPKAAAIAAKAWCLRQDGIPISVTVFERHEVGANWSGSHGYTDGRQPLCTPAERDFGFPYTPTFGEAAAQRMQERFSWQAYQVASATGRRGAYAEWGNRGRKPPTHAQFAGYVRFALARAETNPEIGLVRRIRRTRGRWKVEHVEASGEVYETSGFHGVVITGPGPAMSRVQSINDPRVLNGVNFWRRLPSLRRRLSALTAPVVIIGGGGTAAAITAWFVRQNHAGPIILVNNQAMLHTRTNNFFENALFDDEDTWQQLPQDERGAFTRRLNRGVVWESVTDLLSAATNLTLVPGRATSIRTAGASRTLEVEYENSRGRLTTLAGLVVDATGFDPWAFTRLLHAECRKAIDADRQAMIHGMNDDLSLPLTRWPKLHLPGLSETVGPGHGSLMVLGATADRILAPYYAAASA